MDSIKETLQETKDEIDSFQPKLEEYLQQLKKAKNSKHDGEVALAKHVNEQKEVLAQDDNDEIRKKVEESCNIYKNVIQTAQRKIIDLQGKIDKINSTVSRLHEKYENTIQQKIEAKAQFDDVIRRLNFLKNQILPTEENVIHIQMRL